MTYLFLKKSLWKEAKRIINVIKKLQQQQQRGIFTSLIDNKLQQRQI